MGLIEILEKTSIEYPDKNAVIDVLNDKCSSYKDLYEDVNSFAYILHDNNIVLNQKVAIYFNNSYYQIVAFFSILYTGAVPVLIDGNSCKEEILKFLESSECNSLISEIDKKDILIDLLNREDLNIYVFSYDNYEIENKKINVVTHDYLRNNKNRIDQAKNDKKVMLFTYRGYGYPLCVVISENALINSVKSNNHLTDVDSSLCISLILPFTHIFALTCNILSPLSVGATIVIIKSVMPGKILTYLEKHNVNFIIVVPTLVRVLIHYIKKSNFKLSSLKRGIVGGDRFSQELFDEWLNLTGCILLQGYGLTETCAVLCNQWNNNKPDSIGKTMIGSLAKIVDENGNELPRGKTGKLYIKTHSMMDEYYKKSDITKKILNNEWLDTGDLAYEDKEDFYYFVKREKLIAKLGGITVDVKEVENIVNMHPDIHKAEILIEYDELWQEKLVCRIKTDKKLEKMDIYNFCRNYLSASKIPKEIIAYK